MADYDVSAWRTEADLAHQAADLTSEVLTQAERVRVLLDDLEAAKARLAAVAEWAETYRRQWVPGDKPPGYTFTFDMGVGAAAQDVLALLAPDAAPSPGVERPDCVETDPNGCRCFDGAPTPAAPTDEPKRRLMTEPHDGHSDAEECPGCPHVTASIDEGAPCGSSAAHASHPMPCDSGCQPDWHKDYCAIYGTCPGLPAPTDEDAREEGLSEWACNRGPCWKERGHVDDCEPGPGRPTDEGARLGEGCGSCLRCDPPPGGLLRRMYVCATCGNKRCPAAGDCCRWECSGSNETDQTPVARLADRARGLGGDQ